MAAGNGGSIINISSVAAIRPAPDDLPYAAAKAGLDVLTAGFAQAYGPKVRVNTIMAGPFLTDISDAWDLDAFSDRAKTYALGAAVRRTKSWAPRCTWPATRRVSSPDRCAPSTAGWQSRGDRNRSEPRGVPGFVPPLARRSTPRAEPERREWGVGSDDVSVFHDLSDEEERRLLEERHRHGVATREVRRRLRQAITWPERFGGTGLPAAYEHAFMEEEAAFGAPALHETFSVTVRLIAPTIRLHGDEGQRQRFIRRFLRPTNCAASFSRSPTRGRISAGLDHSRPRR